MVHSIEVSDLRRMSLDGTVRCGQQVVISVKSVARFGVMEYGLDDKLSIRMAYDGGLHSLDEFPGDALVLIEGFKV